MSARTHAFAVVTFFNDYAASTKREELIGLEALADRIRTTTAASKVQLPWLKCARFGDHRSKGNSLRNNENVIAITGMEADYDGEQMSFVESVQIAANAGLRCIIYTSPSHTEDAPRWRVLAFCSREYPPAERDRFLARLNGVFGGIFAPESWRLSQSFFFGSVRQNPSHRAVVVEGACIDLADHLDATAIRPELRETQASQRETRAQFLRDPERIGDDGSLIEKIRARLDLGQVLAAHGYAQRCNVWRHPNSQSGSYGLNIKTFSGIERIYSHNGSDPLHPGNLPAWTAGVTALDVVDVVAILDFGGDRTQCLRELAERFRLTDDVPPFQRPWNAAVAVHDTVAATWLESCGLRHLIGCPELRFHSACPHPTGVRLPALIAAVRDIDGTICSVHRTYLQHDGSGLADIEIQRAALGSVMSGAIRLSSLEVVLAAGELVIAEDIEEAASLGLLLRRPTWAAATAANLAAGIVLPPEVRRVVIANGHTDGGAARSAWFRLKREGRQAQIATPPGDAGCYVAILTNENAMKAAS
jgi:hypothetical protein